MFFYRIFQNILDLQWYFTKTKLRGKNQLQFAYARLRKNEVL